jgi:hypothetical protein
MVKQFATEIYVARARGIVLSEDLRVRIRRLHQACCRLGERGVGWRWRRFVVSVSSTSVLSDGVLISVGETIRQAEQVGIAVPTVRTAYHLPLKILIHM